MAELPEPRKPDTGMPGALVSAWLVAGIQPITLVALRMWCIVLRLAEAKLPPVHRV